MANRSASHTIKGYLYQFDKTLIEVITNPQSKIAFENTQDIDYDDYVLQVKHKEAQEYSHSKIRKPVENLMELFHHDRTKKLCLYCHFKNSVPGDWNLSLTELDSIISAETKRNYPDLLREQFLSSFTVRFSEDYEAQFVRILEMLKSIFSLKTIEEAALYHSIFRSKLLDRSILTIPERYVCLDDLRHFLNDTEVTVFYSAYSKFMGIEKYTKLIKKRYFTSSFPNINNFERLFVIECGDTTNTADLINLTNRLAIKYFRKGKSPQPYIIFRNCSRDKLNKLKQDLYDSEVIFFDGTYFDGDRFRINELINNQMNNSGFVLKISPEEEILSLFQHVKIMEAFQFFFSDPLSIISSAKHIRIQIDNTEQAIQMLN